MGNINCNCFSDSAKQETYCIQPRTLSAETARQCRRLLLERERMIAVARDNNADAAIIKCINNMHAIAIKHAIEQAPS